MQHCFEITAGNMVEICQNMKFTIKYITYNELHNHDCVTTITCNCNCSQNHTATTSTLSR